MAAIARPTFNPLAEGIGIADSLARFPLYAFDLATLPRGKGEPVMVYPGYMVGDGSTAMLRGFLTSLNYRVHTWGGGVNRGYVARLVDESLPRVERLHNSTEAPVRLVGWSLGGIVAREVARQRPDLVHSVITMGTPVAITSRVRSRRPANRDQITVPLTVIYSRSDAVVPWQAALDHETAHAEHIEVRTSHSGLGFNPEVFRIVARRLAT
jgi:pimeloyl-ACP methyl ester carboxylesterase